MKKLLLLFLTFSLFSCQKDKDGNEAQILPIESSIIHGLIAYYPFNGNAKDMTGNGHDGVSKGASLTTDRFGNKHAAYLFNGITSAIKVDDKADLRLSQTNFTINLWVNLDNYDIFNGSSLMMKRLRGANNGWASSLTGQTGGPKVENIIGSIYYTVSGGTDPYGYSKKGLQLKTWDMITMVYSLQNKTMSFFVNGVLDTVTQNIPSPSAYCNAELFIGADNFDTGSTGYHLKGKIDDIGFYDRMLTKAEINRIYFNSETSTPPVFDK